MFSPLLDSLGIVLTRGYGQYIFIGNVSVEEGESESNLCVYVCPSYPLSHVSFFSIFFSSSGLHDLLAPDLTIADEW